MFACQNMLKAMKNRGEITLLSFQVTFIKYAMGKKDRKHIFASGQKLLAPFHCVHYEQDYEVIMITKFYNIIPAINCREKNRKKI